MIFAKTLNFIKELVKKENSNKKYNAEMKIILEKLSDKALKLEVQLENEKNEAKRKNINLMLKVIAKQQQKGKKLMQQREVHSSSSKVESLIIKPELSPRIIASNF